MGFQAFISFQEFMKVHCATDMDPAMLMDSLSWCETPCVHESYFKERPMVGSERNNELGDEGVTDLLQALPERQDDLYQLIYEHLKSLARNRLWGEKGDNWLQATSLVNEAYLRLMRHESGWRDRRHFFGVAGEAMRRILVDAARHRNREKRGGEMIQQPLSGIGLAESEWDVDLLDLHAALTELESRSAELAEIVRLHFFSGLTFQECADLLEVSLSSVERRWRFARAWLRSKISD
jgi:RNA polymerase sigma-70 factor, ECF subfamily